MTSSNAQALQIDVRSQASVPLAHVSAGVLDRSTTLTGALRSLAQRHGDFAAVHILDRSMMETSITPAELWGRALQLHAHFVRAGLEPGCFGILSLPAGIELLAAYFGVILAGGIPGLVASPSNRFADRTRYASRVAGILANARGRLLYCEPQCLDLFAEAGGIDRSAILSPDQTHENLPELAPFEATPDTIATVQYSSGATGAPKGVLITHGAVLANLRALRDGYRIQPSDTFVNWLPLYHDMGLIGTFLLPLLMGSPIVLIPTIEFMRDPKLWLWAVHYHRGTLAFAPNFSLAYCAKRIPPADVEGLDLSSWRVLICGSEPVQLNTVEEFCARYGPHGFRRQTLQTGWGMAENVLVATASDTTKPLAVDYIDRASLVRHGQATPAPNGDALAVCSVGRPVGGCELEIRDGNGRVLPERQVGRVWVRSPSLFVGYHGQPELTAEVLRDGWFDTGDRGYLADGDLYFVARDKDLVVIGGEKYPPHDIESAIGEVPGVRRGCVAAFGLRSERLGTEELAAVAETHETESALLAALHDAIIDRVKRELGLSIRHLFLVPPGGVEKTTSGKLARAATRERYTKEIEP